jgi:hypothetical protein
MSHSKAQRKQTKRREWLAALPVQEAMLRRALKAYRDAALPRGAYPENDQSLDAIDRALVLLDAGDCVALGEFLLTATIAGPLVDDGKKLRIAGSIRDYLAFLVQLPAVEVVR